MMMIMTTLTLKKPPPKQIGRLNLSSSAFAGSVRQPAQLSLKFESNLQIGVGPRQLTSKTTYGSRHRPDVPPENSFYLSSEWWSAFRPNCTALTILTSSCLEVWTGPLPGREMEMMMMTKQKTNRKRKQRDYLLPIPLTAGAGLELGRVPPREKFGFESWEFCLQSNDFLWFLTWSSLTVFSSN